jgi:1,5-anhydro-D-fructose reductase (1,5-anhydro-D-mannitol-forming)
LPRLKSAGVIATYNTGVCGEPKKAPLKERLLAQSPIRLAMLGVSWWTEKVFPGFSSCSDIEIVHVSSRSEEKARNFAQQHGIPNYSGDLREAIHAENVDAVFVAVPNHMHEEVAIGALAVGKHVLLEKPLALGIDKAVALMRIAEQRGLILMPNQEVRLTDAFSDLPQIIEQQIGPLRRAEFTVTKAADTWTGWRANKAQSGGTLFEMALHQLDLLRWVFRRDPPAVWATGQDDPGSDMTIVLDFGGGDTGVVSYCWRSVGFSFRLSLAGGQGTLLQELDVETGIGFRKITTAHGSVETELKAPVLCSETFRRVAEAFVHAVRFGDNPPITAEDGVWAVRMAASAREAMRTGEWTSTREIPV